MISSYRPGDSPVHRAPPAVKLLALVAVGTCTALVRSPLLALGLLVAVLAGYLVAGLGLRPALVQLRPLAWVLAVVAGYHLLAEGWRTAAVVTGGVAALVLLAGLVTLTTRTSALLDVVARLTRPLQRAGVDPERVGLLLALGVRSVPVVVGIAQQVRDAQRARGARVDARHVAVPLVVRSVRHADALAEALVARGLDD